VAAAGADDDDDEGPEVKKAAKRRDRKRKLEQQHGGRDPTRPPEGRLRAARRMRSFCHWMHRDEEEDLHITYRNIE